MKKTCLISLLSMTVVVLWSCKGKEAAQPVVPLEVPVVQVLQQNIALESEFVGQTYGESDVEVRPRVEGWVLTVNFKEGTMVKKGQLLYTIDPLPYQNMVDQASAALAQAQTTMVKAKNDLDRIEPLAKIGAVSQRELVAAQASYDASKAMTESSEAALRNAKIELGYCHVVAPITGIIGLTKVKAGDYVTKGPQFVVTTISSLDKIRVRFTISEMEYLRIARLMEKMGVQVGSRGDVVKMILADGTVYPLRGRVSSANREIDPSTGALTVEAIFNNTNNLLRPGLYVKIKLVTEFRDNAILIPQRAVNEMQGLFQVYTVGDSNKISLKLIKTGPAYNRSYVVEGGLTIQDRVVIAGTQLLRNGSIIKPNLKAWSPDSANIFIN